VQPVFNFGGSKLDARCTNVLTGFGLYGNDPARSVVLAYRAADFIADAAKKRWARRIASYPAPLSMGGRIGAFRPFRRGRECLLSELVP